ncbi:DUF1616 domain-containing protein [Halapricum sp. CBA1109]|uniref:DUF1616 domain-containing protein n=1 Tax=Halapricum sp. CBA1109 TaxID=2668068 RepID=UPI0012FB50D8|nr:DUF1616 domain-containing protein [Halapricum sp. CBA1109]MUV88588.1 DUF1616 domain-containing protein [Halapricum sp. CBA1109]
MVDTETFRRVTTAALFGLLLVSLAGVVYVAVDPPPAERPHTEAYLLDPEGNASEYPTNLTVGENASITAGIVNHEHEPVTYTVDFRLDNRTVTEREVDIPDGQRWERSLSFTPREPGRQRVELAVYHEGKSDPYRTVWLWIDVTAPDRSSST